MTFWSGNELEPLRKFRFLVRLDNNNYRIEAKSVTLPSFEGNLLEHQLINHMVKLPGIGKWGDAVITFVATKDFLQSKILNYTGYRNILQQGSTLTKKKIFKDDPKIELLDENGKVITTWTLFNAFIASINFGELAYSDDEFVEVELTLAMDHAKIE